MENINFEAIIDESSDEEHALSDDSNYISDCSNTDFDDNVVENEQLRAQNQRKICAIHFYYSTGGALALCASCMDTFRDDIGLIYEIRRHKVTSPDEVDMRWCSSCQILLHIIMSRNMCYVCTPK